MTAIQINTTNIIRSTEFLILKKWSVLLLIVGYGWLNSVSMSFEFFLIIFSCVYLIISAYCPKISNKWISTILVLCKYIFIGFLITAIILNLTYFIFFNQLWFSFSELYFNGYIYIDRSIIFLRSILFILIFLSFICISIFLKKFKDFFHSFIEFPFLISGSLFFMVVLLYAADFFLIYICLVGLGICLYSILALHCNFGPFSREAAIKYFILSVFSTGLLLGGIALLFLNFGTLNFIFINQLFFAMIATKAISTGYLFIIKVALIFIFFSFLFKLSAAPVHFWAPEVYSGISYAVLSIIILPLKFIVAVVFLKILKTVFIFAGLNQNWNIYTMFEINWLLLVIIFISIAIGGINAIYEQKIKRFLAYSSINQIGFLFVGLLGFKSYILSIQVFLFFLFVYCLNMFGLFFLFFFIYSSSWIIIQKKNILKNKHKTLYWEKTYFKLIFFRDIKSFFSLNCYTSDIDITQAFKDFYNIYCLFFIIILFSLAGIPPFIGFFSKLFIILYCLKLELWVPVGLLLVFSALSAYYYLKIIRITLFEVNEYNNNIVSFIFLPYMHCSPLTTGLQNYSYSKFTDGFMLLSIFSSFSFIWIDFIWKSLTLFSLDLLLI